MEVRVCNSHQFVMCDQTDDGSESLEARAACITEILATMCQFKLLNTKLNLLYIRNQFVPRSKHFPPPV
jgi:hypothetical protein